MSVTADESWGREILTLPEGRFFNLMRNYLGEVRTPFDKHKLIRELAAFLRRPSHQERLIALLGGRERLVITAVLMLGEPTLEGLRALLEDDMSLFSLEDILTNLEERLVLFRSGRTETPVIAVTPLLRERLEAEVFDPSLLFPSLDAASPRSPAAPWIGDTLLLSTLAYLIAEGSPLRKDGTPKKQALQQLRRLLPAAGESVGVIFSTLAQALVTNGLLDRESLAPRLAAWEVAAAKSPVERLLQLLSAVGGTAWAADPSLLGAFLGSLRRAGPVAYREATLVRLLRLVHLRAGWEAGFGRQDALQLLEGLRVLGFLLAAGEGLAIHPAVDLEAARGGGSAVVQPNYEITLTRDVDLGRGLPVGLACELRRYDAAAVFELTRPSFQRYLDMGGSAETLTRALADLGSRELPQNVTFSLKTWERDYRRLALYEGIVLVADDEHRYLLDNSPTLGPYIRRRLGAGVYLLDPAEREEWTMALARSGVEHVPEIVGAGPPAEAVVPEPAFGPPSLPAPLRLEGVLLSRPRPIHTATGDEIRRDLKERLERLDLRSDDQTEIQARIDKGLIIIPRQIRPLRTPGDKSEARGLDYLGKIRVVERALREQAMLEIIQRGASGEPSRMTVVPGQLEKGSGGLLLTGTAMPDRKPVRIAVARISLVRRISRSLLD